ncbi:MAG: hypothetical protein HC936_08735 [Leptolyngbyaceae cyanobacterium SU_3_3]|nr:hypothetical protein [Leptolyngbyaceae cyanobacterium SU_3_3]
MLINILKLCRARLLDEGRTHDATTLRDRIFLWRSPHNANNDCCHRNVFGKYLLGFA